MARLSVLSVTTAFALVVSTAQAQWTLVDDFQGLTVGDAVDGTSGGAAISTWDGGGTHTAEVDPDDASNLALQVLGTNGAQVLRAQFEAANVIAAGNTGTVYYRFRTPDTALGGTTDQVVGLTDNADITNFNFKAGLRNTTTADPANNLDARNGGTYEQVSLLADSTWYSLWMVANNTDPGVHELYLQSDTDSNFATQTRLATAAPDDTFDFRVNGATDIVNFYFRGGNNDGGTADSNLYYDDIWINSSASDLTFPAAAVPEPSSVAIVLSGMGMFFMRRQRR